MGADSYDSAVRAAEFVGITLSEGQKRQLVLYHDWLADEATRAGGIGPHERDRIWRRHIADSLAFGIGVVGARDCLDIGTGVGLPGVPLAVAFPQTAFVLVDRSGRRCDLVRRAIAILRLENCGVVEGEIAKVSEAFSSIVSRAAVPPASLLIHVKRLLEPGGVAILGLSHADYADDRVPEDAEVRISVVSIPADILDSNANLLRIEAT